MTAAKIFEKTISKVMGEETKLNLNAFKIQNKLQLKLKTYLILLQAMKLLQEKTPEATLKAMKELAELAKEIPAAMTECKATYNDLMHLIAAI